MTAYATSGVAWSNPYTRFLLKLIMPKIETKDRSFKTIRSTVFKTTIKGF